MDMGVPEHFMRDVCRRATKEEQTVSRNSSWNMDKSRQLAFAVDEVLADLEPTVQDRESRAALVRYMDNFVKNTITGASIAPYGSFLMNMFTQESDLDLSLEINCAKLLSRDERVFYLRRFTVSLYHRPGLFENVQPIYKASVPLVRFTYKKYGINCDVSVDNGEGVLKSSFLAALSIIDNRFRPLCFLLKKWASSHGINDASAGTLNSYALSLLAAFHLQTCSPPILPPLSFLLEGLDVRDASYSASVARSRAKPLQGYGSRNLEAVSELFRTFFIKMAPVKELWIEGLCASTLYGQWISKCHGACLCVEDFLDQTQNAARSVTRAGFDGIYESLEGTLRVLQSPIFNAETLKKTLFEGVCVPKIVVKPQPKHTSPGFPNPLSYRSNLMPQFHRHHRS